MWTVNIKDKGAKQEVITIQVEFSDGTENIVRNFAGNSQAELDSKIQKYLDLLETRDADISKVELGTWTPKVEEVPEKTAEELAQEAWLEQWKKYQGAKKGMEELAAAGVTPTDEETAAFEALKTWVADNRKPEYTHLIANSI